MGAVVIEGQQVRVQEQVQEQVGKFEDVHAFDGGQCYIIPNESVQAWKKLMSKLVRDGAELERAAGICSGGEIGFFSILPFVKQDVVLVDHSYRSLAVAMIKYLIVKEHGAEKAHTLFTAGEAEPLKAAIKAAVAQLPGKVAQAYNSREFGVVFNYDGQDFLKRQFAVREFSDSWGRSYTRTDYTKSTGIEVNTLVTKEWKKLPKVGIKKLKSSVDRVQFMHADLSDLVERGPFDLLYLSNAMEHIARTRKYPDGENLEAAVKPGGYILLATRPSSHASRSIPKTWNLVAQETVKKSFTDKNDDGKMTWSHQVYQVSGKEEVG